MQSPNGADLPGLILSVCIIVNLALVGLWDLFTRFQLVPGRSVSSYLTEWAGQFLPGVLAVGLILGHLLWPPDVRR